MELAKTTPEQRAEIYEDVRRLIVPGYLAHVFTIGDASFVVRSLDKEDYEVLSYRTHGAEERIWKAWIVATATWMVNGSLVIDDENTTYRLYEMFSGLPSNALNTLYSIVNGLMRRVLRAGEVTESFLYEQESRSLWQTEGPAILTRRRTQALQRFSNSVISLWIYFNQMEDIRESQDYDWTLSKFVTGPHAPKSLKKINAQDNKRAADMRRRRESLQDRIYYEAKGLLARKEDEEGSKSKVSKPFGEVVMAETEEDLRESMRRWVAGIKDDHDRVVDNIKARIKHGVEEQKREAERRREELDRALEEEGLSRNQLTPLHGEAGKKFMDRMRSRIPGARKVFNDNTHNSAYEKYIENNPEVGDMFVDEDGNLVSSRNVTEDMLDVLTNPEGGGRPSLQEQVESRRPSVNFEDEE